MLRTGCFMAKLDLKDAYHLEPIKKSHKKILRFKLNNSLYEYNCLPFGLSIAPFVFTKLKKPLISFLRRRGFIYVIYLDDFLLIGNSYEICNINVSETIRILEQLGFLVNYKKSNLIPRLTCK